MTPDYPTLIPFFRKSFSKALIQVAISSLPVGLERGGGLVGTRNQHC